MRPPCRRTPRFEPLVPLTGARGTTKPSDLNIDSSERFAGAGLFWMRSERRTTDTTRAVCLRRGTALSALFFSLISFIDASVCSTPSSCDDRCNEGASERRTILPRGFGASCRTRASASDTRYSNAPAVWPCYPRYDDAASPRTTARPWFVLGAQECEISAEFEMNAVSSHRKRNQGIDSR